MGRLGNFWSEGPLSEAALAAEGPCPLGQGSRKTVPPQRAGGWDCGSLISHGCKPGPALWSRGSVNTIPRSPGSAFGVNFWILSLEAAQRVPQQGRNEADVSSEGHPLSSPRAQPRCTQRGHCGEHTQKGPEPTSTRVPEGADRAEGPCVGGDWQPAGEAASLLRGCNRFPSQPPLFMTGTLSS